MTTLPHESTLVPFSAVRLVGRGPALILAPHPDDEVLGCAGAIMRHRAAGESVHVVVATDGGWTEEAIDRPAYVSQRRRESQKAAMVLGCEPPTFWMYADRELSYGEELVEQIAAEIEKYESRLVYAPAPTEIHPDHNALSMATIEAVRRSKKPVSAVFYEVGQPLQANLFLDISDLEERKREAISCFPSQLAKQRYDHHVAALNRYRTYTLGHGVTAAEAYRVVSHLELQDDLQAAMGPLPRPLLGGRMHCAPDTPLISVIVRTCGRDTLAAALDSIAAQTWMRLEVIVVDAKGGLPPQGRTCGRFPLRQVGGDRPLGRSAAANAGLEASRGSHIVFLDDDDWFLPHHLAALYDALMRQRSARVAYAGIECIEVGADGKRRRTHVASVPFDAARLRGTNFIPIHAAMFERSLFSEDACRFDEALALCEDWDFWLQLSRHTCFVQVPQVGAAYRFPGGSPYYAPGAHGAAIKSVFDKWHQKWTQEEMFPVWCSARERYAALEECTAAKEHLALAESQAAALPGLRAELAAMTLQAGEARAEAAVAKAAEARLAQEALVLREHLRKLQDELALSRGAEEARSELQSAMDDMASSSAVRTARFLSSRAPGVHVALGRLARAGLVLLGK